MCAPAIKHTSVNRRRRRHTNGDDDDERRRRQKNFVFAPIEFAWLIKTNEKKEKKRRNSGNCDNVSNEWSIKSDTYRLTYHSGFRLMPFHSPNDTPNRLNNVVRFIWCQLLVWFMSSATQVENVLLVEMNRRQSRVVSDTWKWAVERQCSSYVKVQETSRLIENLRIRWYDRLGAKAQTNDKNVEWMCLLSALCSLRLVSSKSMRIRIRS